MSMISRRSFLKGTGVVAGALALTACGGSSSSTAPASSAAGTTDFSAVLAEFDAGAANLADWANKFDTIIDKVRTETDFAKRADLMHEAEDVLMSTWALMPIYFYTDMYLQKDYVTGVQNNVFGMKRFMYAKNTNNPDQLNICLASEPDYTDPRLSTSVDGGCLASNMFLGVMTLGADGNPIPGCAESYTVSDDGTVYTFTMKDGLKWSDGEALTAADFVYSWNTCVDPNTGCDYGYLFDVVAKNDDGTVKAEASADGKTLTVTLISPCPYFLDLCAFPTFYPVPKAHVEAANTDGTQPGKWAQEAGFVTNGAYTMTAWNHNESLTLSANPNFVDAANVTMPKLNFMLSADTTAIHTAYLNGDLDFADSVPTEEVETQKKGTELKIDPQLGTAYTCANVNSPLFTEGRTAQQAIALRKALTLQIDRDYIVETITQGGQVPANCFIPKGCADGNGGIFYETTTYTYPVASAKGYFDPAADNSEEIANLLQAAGLTLVDGMVDQAATPFTFEYLTNPGGGNIAIAEAQQQDFAALGIEMGIAQQEWAVMLDSRKNGDYDVSRNAWVMDYNDPINMLEMWLTDSGNNDAQFGK
ncbi:MAG: twin-arginine translocation signal domain-containing protein [Faecalibacterium sp.]|nr:twin-arginine translocation signal domain-containing protein [Faecalibacterium sp.]